jgi:hypothetical protein
MSDEKIPTTVEEAVDELVSLFPPAEKNTILEGDPLYHFGAGMALRNAWGLWQPESPIRKDAILKYRLGHADDISGLIFEWAFAKIRKQDFDPDKLANKYHKHWNKSGTTSIDASGGLPPSLSTLPNNKLD